MIVGSPTLLRLAPMDSAIPLLLLKTKSTPSDAYAEHFSASPKFRPFFLPVLKHSYNSANLARLKDLLLAGAFGHPVDVDENAPSRYGGVIFTSQRAVEGFANVLAEVADSNPLLDLLKVPIYVVGPATSRAVTLLRNRFFDSSSFDILGADAGNGDKLAVFILSHYNSLHSASKPPLLFIVGEQRRDVIPKTLQSETLAPLERIRVDEIPIYETGVMDSFPADLAGVLSANSSAPMTWVVVFSPTGCEAMLHGLGILPRSSSLDVKHRKYFIATIGPTTQAHLRKLGVEADVCASSPSPEGVKDGIDAFLRENRLEHRLIRESYI